MSVEYGKTRKKICFDSHDKLHADLKIRLHYDGIKIREFFNGVVQAYLDKNSHMISLIEEIKENKSISKTRRKKVKLANLKEKETINKFALSEGEIENIFDILEKELDK